MRALDITKQNKVKQTEKKALMIMMILAIIAIIKIVIIMIIIITTTIITIVKMQNTCNLIGWNSVHIFDIFSCNRANINGMWNAGKLIKHLH